MTTLFEHFQQGLEYSTYVDLYPETLQLTEEEYPYLKYVKLNWARHKRLSKKLELRKDFSQFSHLKLKVLIISEVWCGDAAQNIPFIYEVCNRAEFELRFALRDSTSIIENYLTNGGKSIPKIIFFNEEGEKFVWGPRPAPLQKMVMDNKKNGQKSYDELMIDIQKWYNADSYQTLEEELYTAFSEL